MLLLFDGNRDKNYLRSNYFMTIIKANLSINIVNISASRWYTRYIISKTLHTGNIKVMSSTDLYCPQKYFFDLLNQTEIRLYLPLYWFYLPDCIYQMVKTIWFWFGLTKFGKKILCMWERPEKEDPRARNIPNGYRIRRRYIMLTHHLSN